MRSGGKTLVTQLSGVGQRRSALVCDSEPQSLRTLKATLRGSGLVMWPTASAEEALTVAAMERQALERLKESRRADHEREVARREGLLLDEMAINGFRRRAA